MAKQIGTLYTLSGGRVHMGLSVGRQRAEYYVLIEDFGSQGR